MIESIVLGIIQGIAEWLPVSSEGMIALAETHLFGRSGLEHIVKFALFLHLGTLGASVLYFRKDIARLLKTLFQYAKADQGKKKEFNFILISTLISAPLGLGLVMLLIGAEEQVEFSGRALTVIIGLLLLVTAYLQLKKKREGERTVENLTWKDNVLLGIAQGFAALPGLSRSGLTVSVLLLRKVDDVQSLRLSFLMSIPIILGGNILLNMNSGLWSKEGMWGLLFAFVFGLATIHLLLRIAKKVNFGYFVGIFGILMIIAGVVS